MPCSFPAPKTELNWCKVLGAEKSKYSHGTVKTVTEELLAVEIEHRHEIKMFTMIFVEI